MVEEAGARAAAVGGPDVVGDAAGAVPKRLAEWDSGRPLTEAFRPEQFAALVAEARDEEVVFRAARLVCGGGVPAAQVRSWATHLLCAGACGAGESPFAVLGALAADSQRACGHVFALGDIAWNCRTCQKDNTCVLCDACFRRSNHRGHEVFFHRAAPGGCCDCGDPEAWVAEGCCERHRPRESTKGDDDPLATLPAALRRNGRAVARAAALEIVAACVESQPIQDTFNLSVPERIFGGSLSSRRGTTGSRRPTGPRKPRETSSI